MAWETMKKRYDHITIVIYLKADLIKKTNSHVKRARSLGAICRPSSGLWTPRPPRLLGLGESNKQMRRMGVEWQNVVYQSSAVSALWFRLCYYIIKFGRGSCFLRDYVGICCLNMCQPVIWGPSFTSALRLGGVYWKSELASLPTVNELVLWS